jgi:hypothetical protein
MVYDVIMTEIQYAAFAKFVIVKNGDFLCLVNKPSAPIFKNVARF